MVLTLTAADLDPWGISGAKATQLVELALAQAEVAAPCLLDPATTLTDAQARVARAILIGACVRWSALGEPVQQMSAGPYGVTLRPGETSTAPRMMLYASERAQLQDLCASPTAPRAGATRAFAVGTDPTWLPYGPRQTAGGVVQDGGTFDLGGGNGDGTIYLTNADNTEPVILGREPYPWEG